MASPPISGKVFKLRLADSGSSIDVLGTYNCWLFMYLMLYKGAN